MVNNKIDLFLKKTQKDRLLRFQFVSKKTNDTKTDFIVFNLAYKSLSILLSCPHAFINIKRKEHK